ncbi:MAG: M28 family peptidase [Halobacteriales archaeon]
MSDWVGDIFTSDLGWNHLETLVDIGNRMAGTPGERAGAEATRDALEDVGARDVHLDPFDIQGWTRGRADVLAGDTVQSAIALPRSPPGAPTGELVDLGYGLPEDFERDLEGAIVMVASNVPSWYDRFIHRKEKYDRAVDAGAAGFVFRNHVEGCLPPTGSIGSEASPVGAIPAVGVSSEVGHRLRRRWAGESVTVEVEADVHDATSQNVHADLGPDTEEAILLTSHVDAHDIAEGAGDNGAGTALVLEMANALLAREDELDRRVHVTVFGAEEVGLRGSVHASRTHDLEAVAAVVNNDGVVRGRTLECYTHGFDELASAIEAVADRTGHPIEVSPELNPHSDHWPYVQWGVPGVHVMSDTGEAGRGWGHTAADTLDKLDVRDLRAQAYLLTELVVDLSDRDRALPRREPEAIAAQLEAEDLAAGMRLTGEWPY